MKLFWVGLSDFGGGRPLLLIVPFFWLWVFIFMGFFNFIFFGGVICGVLVFWFGVGFGVFFFWLGLV